MRLPHLVPIGLALACATGCDEPQPAKPSPPSSATASARTATTAAATASAPMPDPLSVALLRKELGCPSKRATEPCGVLDSFTACQPMDRVAPSGDARWMGYGYEVKEGEYVEQVTLVRVRRVPLNDVGPGQMPLKVSIVELPDDEVSAQRHAKKAIDKLSRDDVPKSTNAAVNYVKKRKPWPESFAVQAQEKQVYVAVEDGAYLCNASDQRLLVVQRAKARKSPADGLYAVLWPVSW